MRSDQTLDQAFQRYAVGEFVFVCTDRVKPEVHDEAFAVERYASVFLIGVILVISGIAPSMIRVGFV